MLSGPGIASISATIAAPFRSPKHKYRDDWRHRLIDNNGLGHTIHLVVQSFFCKWWALSLAHRGSPFVPTPLSPSTCLFPRPPHSQSSFSPDFQPCSFATGLHKGTQPRGKRKLMSSSCSSHQIGALAWGWVTTEEGARFEFSLPIRGIPPIASPEKELLCTLLFHMECSGPIW